MIRSLLLAAALGLPAAAADAQQVAQYRRQPADTLRYREVTKSDVQLASARGNARIGVLHEATIALTFAGADTARAWYESLQITATRDSTERRLDTDSVLKQPFVLLFPPAGDITTLSAPPFPGSFDGITDLQSQFEDFIFTLPTKPLRKGLTWADTSVVADTTATDGTRSVTTRITQRKVVGDSTRNGRVVTVFSTDIRTQTLKGGPVPGEPLRYRESNEVRESGLDYYDRAAGVFAGRRRLIVITGMTEYMGASRPVSLTTNGRIESSIELISR